MTARSERCRHLGKAARPAVRDHQRQRIRPHPALMDEVNAHAVDRGRELGKRIQIPLPHLPVEVRTPVLDELAQIAEFSAGRPSRADRQRRGPARASQPRPEIAQDLFGDGDRVRLDPDVPTAGHVDLHRQLTLGRLEEVESGARFLPALHHTFSVWGAKTRYLPREIWDLQAGR
jgi:hypothetical protein